MKKLLKDLAAFAVADMSVLFVACVIFFSVSMTAGVVEQYRQFGFIPFELVVACVVQTILMIGAAMKMAYDEFEEFREQHEVKR